MRRDAKSLFSPAEIAAMEKADREIDRSFEITEEEKQKAEAGEKAIKAERRGTTVDALEKKSARDKRYYQRHKEKKKADAKKYREEHTSEVKRLQHSWYLNHREDVKKKQLEYYRRKRGDTVVEKH